MSGTGSVVGQTEEAQEVLRIRFPSAGHVADLMKAMTAVVEEGTFKVTQEGLWLTDLDPGHISLVDFELKKLRAGRSGVVSASPARGGPGVRRSGPRNPCCSSPSPHRHELDPDEGEDAQQQEGHDRSDSQDSEV